MNLYENLFTIVKKYLKYKKRNDLLKLTPIKIVER